MTPSCITTPHAAATPGAGAMPRSGDDDRRPGPVRGRTPAATGADPVTATELALLDFYRASELHGGLVLGKLAGRCRDPELVLALTRHAAEEVRHAELWTGTILALGGRPGRVRHTYQARYAAILGPLRGLRDVLALTQVFERRVYRHFLEHERRPGTHPAVRATLRTMIEEEQDHLSWVWRWLTGAAARRGGDLEETMRRFQEADDRIYARLRREFGWPPAA